MSQQPRQISEYQIIRKHDIDDFEEAVQDALSDGWQPMSRDGFEGTDEYDYIMEMVKMQDYDTYREMVFELQEEHIDYAAEQAQRRWNTSPIDPEAIAIAEPPTRQVLSPHNESLLGEAAREFLRQRPRHISDNELLRELGVPNVPVIDNTEHFNEDDFSFE